MSTRLRGACCGWPARQLARLSWAARSRVRSRRRLHVGACSFCCGTGRRYAAAPCSVWALPASAAACVGLESPVARPARRKWCGPCVAAGSEGGTVLMVGNGLCSSLQQRDAQHLVWLTPGESGRRLGDEHVLERGTFPSRLLAQAASFGRYVDVFVCLGRPVN